MSVRALFLLSVVFCRLGAEAATLKGVILANGHGGPPVAGVQVSAAGANTTTTGEGGSFTLEFPNAQPGDRVQLTVRKSGYLVVNDFELLVHLPRNADADILTLLLCKEAERDKWVSQLYGVAYSGAIDKRVAELEKSGQQGAAATGRSRAQAFVKNGDWEHAGPKPGKTSELYAEALPLFLRGDVSGALKVLGDDILAQSMEDAKRKKERADEALAKMVQVYMFKASLLVTQFQFDEAERVYVAAIQAAPDSADAHFYYADFSAILNRRSVARREFQKVLDIEGRDGAFKYGVLSTLIDLGSLDLDENRLTEARREYEDALRLAKGQVLHDPSTYFPLMAGILYSLGLLNEKEDDRLEARRDYDEALSIYGLLESQDPNEYSADRATTLNNLGKLDAKEGRKDDAREHFEQAIQIYRKLETKSPGTNLRELARAQINLGSLDAQQGRAEQAHERMGEALNTYDRLARTNTETYLPDLAWAQGAIAAVEAERGRTEEARQYFGNALANYRELVRQDPEAYTAELALTLRNFGSFEKDQNHVEAASALLREALSHYRDLSNRDPHYEGNATEIESILETLRRTAK